MALDAQSNRSQDRSAALPTDAAGELDVLGHDRNALGVDGTEVGVLKEPDKVGLRRLLESEDGRGLEAKVGLDILGDLTDETLEGRLADEKVCTLLVLTNLAEGDGAGTEAMRLLDASGSGGRDTGGLGGEVLAGSLATGGLAGSLLRARHYG